MTGDGDATWTRDERGEELSPGDAPRRWERTVASIVRAAGPELRRRAADPGVAGLIGRWSRPLVAAAAVLIVAASVALLWSSDDPGPGTDRLTGGADAGAPSPAPAGDLRREAPAAGLETAVYPAPVGPWMADDDARPTVEEIVFSASAPRNRP